MLVRLIGACALFLVCLVGPTWVTAQHPSPVDEWRTESWVGDVAFASASSLIAGVTAGVIQELRDGSFRDGFTGGALGGAIAYGGRRIASARFSGAGLIGRQVSGVGLSITRNAGYNQPILSHVWLPLGPVYVLVDNSEDVSISAHVDVFASGWILAAILDDRLEFDAESTLSSGAAVFHAPGYYLLSDGRPVGGQSIAGVVVLPGSHSPAEVLAHERVHVLQYDFAQLIWGDPMEEYVGRYSSRVSAMQRHLRFGVLFPGAASGLNWLADFDERRSFWETEAYYLDGR